MKRTVQIRESSYEEVDLSAEEAQSVAALGVTLASKSTYWGTSDADTIHDERTIISCSPISSGRWRLFVNNAIGAFGVGDATFIVEPKIPMQHVLFIFSKATAIPRLDNRPLSLGSGQELWELVALWFLSKLREIISRDLIRDYHNTEDVITSARGQIDAMATSGRYYVGSLSFSCRYDEFTIDNPHNRLLLAGLEAILTSSAVSVGARSNCRRFASYFEGVGPLQKADSYTTVDRRSAHYEDALNLARLIISANAVNLKQGDLRAWTFLIRTPETVEAGIRAVLKDGLQPSVEVRKYGTALRPSEMSINPDLRFDPAPAVGDIKYKVFGDEWPRSDLYQSVAFAAGSGSDQACVVSFTKTRASLPTVHFRTIGVSSLVWDAREEISPADASLQLVADCRSWLDGRAVLALP